MRQPASPEGPHRPVIVFDPSPLLTVEIEQAPSGKGKEIHFHAGGQGFWISRMVARLEAPVTLIAPFGDETGLILPLLMERDGVNVRVIESRLANGAFVHERQEGNRIELAEAPSAELSRHEVDELYNAAIVAGMEAGVVVLAGPRHGAVLPADTYRRLPIDLRANGATVIADLSGEALRAALAGGLDFLKISHEEAIAADYMETDDLESAVAAVHALRQAGAENVLLTRAGEPAVVLIDGQVGELVTPRMEPLDHRGAGDSLTAGLAAGLARGLDAGQALRLAASAGALNVTRHGLGSGNRETIEQFAKYVEFRALSE
jgi:1-phosphofructokinase